MRLFKSILLLPLACTATIAPAGPSIRLEDAAVIDQPIFQSNLDPIGKFLSNAAKTKSEVHLIINSPGGSVMTGFAFLNRMDDARAKGLTINCYVPELAASMAFQILLHCDHRYALPRAALLWHRVSVQVQGASLNALNTADLLRELSSADRIIIQDLKAHLPMDEKLLLFHLDKETLHTAPDLNKIAPGFLDAIPETVPGLYDAIDSDKVVRQSSPFDLLKKLFGGEIFYIRKEFIIETLQN